ncbi:hypothetical protein GCM10010992_15050 [Cloacibacterium rupense]|uniref:DUF2062 domain-containing protein n=1 Tax=Cloacibacterium rupense TaxID=517423 RepID=A0ABQ2NJL1_9FLAO|nr:DUF2062 domain-containing protein [Cloacibacterium rupense]GGP04098.1 hypothetical protein GCM10010992_15050 [Cloacibacterium rupense]
MKNFIQNSIQSQKIFYRYFRRKGFKRFFKENILETDGSNKNKAFSIALGIFIGLSPFWGFHSVLVISLAVILKLNKFLSFIFSQIISLPFFVPFTIAASLFFGSYFISGEKPLTEQEFNLETVKENLLQYIIGSLIFASLFSVIAGFIFYFLMKFFKEKKEKTH